MTGYAANDLLNFLHYSLEKGLGKPETLKTRIVSVGRIVEAVGEEEFKDVRNINVDHIMERFHNLEGAKYSPGSFASYRSRLNSSLSDFLRYKENPANYRPKGQRASREKMDQAVVKKAVEDNDVFKLQVGQSLQQRGDTCASNDEAVFPIPLRQGLIVRLIGLPHDLTQNEAQRIANVVKAMAIIEE